MLSLSVDPAARGALDRRRLMRFRTRMGRMLRAAQLAEASARGLELGVLLTGDARIRELNRDYRGKDRPTDVLAFSQREGDGPGLHPELLGDVVISVETAARQARRGLPAEVLTLGAHGLCHLLGYDHRTDAEEAEMNARVRALLAESRRRGPTRPA